MRIEKIDEPIEVIGHFASGKLKPLRFLWNGRAHKVEAVRGRWITLEGKQRSYHYAVTAQGVGSCELAFDLEMMAWLIKSVSITD